MVRSLGFCWNRVIGDGEAWFPVELHEHKRHLLTRIRLQQREQHPEVCVGVNGDRLETRMFTTLGLAGREINDVNAFSVGCLVDCVQG